MATYYVDNQAIGASDTNSGSVYFPFLTLAKANNVAVSGDTVLVKPGTYREQLTCKSSGVTWQAYSRGVYITGSVIVTATWSATATNAYVANISLSPTPLLVVVDGNQYWPSSSATTTTAGQFYYDSGASMLYVDMGGTDPTSHAIEVGSLSTGVTLPNLSDCAVRGFNVINGNGYGILIQGGGSHTIKNNTVMGHPSGGVRLQPLSPQLYTPADAGAGGTLTAGEYGYIVSAVIGGQETMPSFEMKITIASNHIVRLEWSKIPTADSFNIYGRTPLGETLIANIANSFGAAFPNWQDDGSLTPDGTTHPPTSTTVNLTPCYVDDNEIMRNNSHGVYLYAAVGCYVRGNKSHHNGFHGVALLNGSNNNTVEFNVCYKNARVTARLANGIQADAFGAGTPGSSGNIIQFNRCFRNEDSGISIYSDSHDCIIRRNVCYRNGDHGIDISNATNCHLVNNVAYMNVTAGINAEGASQGVRMYNNIAMDNGIDSPRTSGNYRVDNNAYSDAEVDYNASYLTVPAASQPGGPGLSNFEFMWGTTGYDTFGEFRAAAPSQMVHGISSNPYFKSVAHADFSISKSSPARDMGSSSAPSYINTDFNGVTSSDPPDAGAIEYA